MLDGDAVASHVDLPDDLAQDSLAFLHRKCLGALVEAREKGVKVLREP